MNSSRSNSAEDGSDWDSSAGTSSRRWISIGRPLRWGYLSFSARLTLGLTGLFAIILGLGYWSLFIEFQQELANEFDRSLHNYATDLLKNIDFHPSGKANLPYEMLIGEGKIFPFPHGDALVKIYRRPYKTLYTYSSDPDAPQDFEELALKGHTLSAISYLDLTSKSGALWRGALMPIDEHKPNDIFMLVAVPRKSLTEQENKFRSIFFIGQIIILMFSVLMLSILARGLLVSLERITQSIQKNPSLSSNFSFEIPSGPPEISVLARLLNQLLSRLQQSLTAHQEFVAQAAHQLKTPLTIARGHLEQELQKNPNSEQSHNLSVAMEELDLMSSTITHLLNLVQLESGFQKLTPIDVDLLDQLLSHLDRFEYLAKRKNLKFQVFCGQEEKAADAEWTLQTDPQLLSIILQNLIENAIKYASRSPLEIKLFDKDSVFQLIISNHYHVESLIPENDTLKEKFIRGNQPEPGQGLGLYIAYKVASLLKIKFSLSKRERQFYVALDIPKRWTYPDPSVTHSIINSF